MKYDYTKLYNKYWQKFMDEIDIDSIGIIRKDKDGDQVLGFANVFSDDDSPYDFCARIGFAILSNLSQTEIETLEVTEGSYVLAGYKNK